jgi:hypothetical protein
MFNKGGCVDSGVYVDEDGCTVRAGRVDVTCDLLSARLRVIGFLMLFTHTTGGFSNFVARPPAFMPSISNSIHAQLPVPNPDYKPGGKPSNSAAGKKKGKKALKVTSKYSKSKHEYSIQNRNPRYALHRITLGGRTENRFSATTRRQAGHLSGGDWRG